MGFGDNLSILIVCLGIVILGTLTALYQFTELGDPPHSGSYFITDLHFIPSRAVVLPESHLGLDDSMHDELNRTEFIMSVEVLNTNTSWTQEYRYKLRNGDDAFVRDDDNRTTMLFSHWSYGVTYTYSIRFMCNSTNVTVLGLPILDEERYFHGSFSIIKGRNDRVKFFDESDLLHKSDGHTFVLYYGDVNEHGLLDDYVLYVELEERGITDSA